MARPKKIKVPDLRATVPLERVEEPADPAGDGRDGATGDVALGSRPGASDFWMSNEGNYGPLPTVLIETQKPPQGGNEHRAVFLNNLLRSAPDSDADIQDEMTEHATVAYERHRHLDTLDVLEALRIGGTAVGGRARSEFIEALGQIAKALRNLRGADRMDGMGQAMRGDGRGY